MKPKNVYLCIHAHFYQPPRENPWLEEVEFQESSAPHHDWNERIYYQCYLPNAMARVLDDKGRILDIVNNYEQISFNFGPTLLGWIRDKHPVTYQHIQSGDQISALNHGGHGNAIAQVYNHMIMPLANHRDKVTQVRWGMADFRFHFGRTAESIWLSETACNEETLEVLIEEGIKYIILEPNQAQAYRALNGQSQKNHDAKWHDVSSGSIDPKFSYRAFSQKNHEKFIDIFFYDGPISKQAGFGDLAYEANLFADRLLSANADNLHDPQLIHIATDGETYGHHKAFGERALAYLVHGLAQKKGFQLTNYGEYLEKFPPRFEVKLKDDSSGGTSWSCAHGVLRWKDHCGCRGDGPFEWTQHWRKPLREALDWLRDELAQIFESFGSRYLHQIWDARNDYIEIIINRSEDNIQKVLNRHAKQPLERPDVITVLKLLESQRHAMLMYTSCGWFFSELSGLESVLILKFASRAIQLAEEVSGLHLEEAFLKKIAHAKSNMAQFKDGRGVYEQLVIPSKLDPKHILSNYAIHTILDPEKPIHGNLTLYCYELRSLFEWKQSIHGMMLCLGRVNIKSKITLEENDYVYLALHIGVYEFRCYLKPFYEVADMARFERDLFEQADLTDAGTFMRKIETAFGNHFFALKDLPLEERMQIISRLTSDMIAKIGNAYERLYDENWKMSEFYRSINLPIPHEIRYAVEYTLARRLKAAVVDLSRSHYDISKSGFVSRLVEIEKVLNVKIKKDEVSKFLSRELARKTKAMITSAKEDLVQECLLIYKLATSISAELYERPSQDHLVHLFKKWKSNIALKNKLTDQVIDSIYELAALLGINADHFKSAIQKASANG